MTKHYRDYVWKNGLPYGIQAFQDDLITGITYKIISDPYHKHNSIEKYLDGKFSQIIYDSHIFDFRHLKPALQTAWQKTTIDERDNKIVCHIRDQDDRLILIEEYLFEKDRCRRCHVTSPIGIHISTQMIYYTDLGDPFNGVTLYDSNSHPVLIKKYERDESSNEFTELLEEQWELTNALPAY